MTAQPVAVHAKDRSACWCCGNEQPAGKMINLGSHPEVTICLRCAHSLHNQARAHEDADRPSPAARGRDVLRAGRRYVMSRDWQHKPVIGPVLRWLGPRMP